MNLVMCCTIKEYNESKRSNDFPLYKYNLYPDKDSFYVIGILADYYVENELEIKKWFEENNIPFIKSDNACVLIIEKYEDAMLFKLRWDN